MLWSEYVATNITDQVFLYGLGHDYEMYADAFENVER